MNVSCAGATGRATARSERLLLRARPGRRPIRSGAMLFAELGSSSRTRLGRLAPRSSSPVSRIVTFMNPEATASKPLSDVVVDWLGSLGRQASSMGADISPEFLDAGAFIIEALGSVQSRELSGPDLLDFIRYVGSRRPQTTKTMLWMLADLISYGVQQELIPVTQEHAPFMLASLEVERPDLTITMIAPADPDWIQSRKANDEAERKHLRSKRRR